ncbi:MAG TPA: porin [Chitinophagaceae bacterium]|nr:porin [Chitinophagaceae bacterium]
MLLLSMLLPCVVHAQNQQDIYGSGLKLNLNNDGSKFVRFIFWNQIWVRHIENNPGTAINGEPSKSTWDVGARRLRVLAYAQVTPRYLILTHFGINNQSFATGGASATSGTGAYGAGKKPGIFFHDVWNEYAIVPAKNPTTGKVNKRTLSLGAGLHYWNGISRMGSASTLTFMTIDAPIVNWPLVDVSDQFVRQFGLYAKGTLGKFHYQLHLNKPFATNSTPGNPDAIKGSVAVDNNGDAKWATGGYFDYQFLDQEPNLLPFRAGTWVGTKKVFNIGAGFYHNKNGTMSKQLDGTSKKHDIALFGVDMFADLPIGDKKKNMAVTAYSVFYNYNFGPNYLRTVGIMNPSTGFDPAFTGEKTMNGAGNGRMFVGTGNIWYTQAGLLLPKGKSDKLRWQPFAAYTYKKLDALDQAGSYFDVGFNCFLNEHHAKITPQYSTRPLYYNRNGQRVADGTRGEFLLQFQVFL